MFNISDKAVTSALIIKVGVTRHSYSYIGKEFLRVTNRRDIRGWYMNQNLNILQPMATPHMQLLMHNVLVMAELATIYPDLPMHCDRMKHCYLPYHLQGYIPTLASVIS